MKSDTKEKLFLDLLKENKDRIYRICYAYLNDKSEVDDLFQEVMVNIWKHLESFRKEAAISTWIYRIAVNTALLYIRSEKKRNTLFSKSTQEIENIKIESESLENEIEKKTLMKKLYACIRLLPKLDRSIISLVLEDIQYKEIADILGISVSNVGVKINRIKKQLSKMMEVENEI